MLIAKLLFAAFLICFSWAVLRALQNRPSETRVLRWLVIGVTIAKFPATVLVYRYLPQLNTGSDAIQFYFPQALSVLKGLLPYRDFQCSYSPLFPFLIAPLVSVWRSVGSIALTMLIFETAMLAVYLSDGKRRGFENRWRVAFLYVTCPISVDWVAVTGYNGPILSFFGLLGLTLAVRKREFAAGLALASGVISSKVLMLLMWPAVPLAHRRGYVRIAFGAFGLCALVAAVLLLLGLDVAAPVRREMFRLSSGNLWFLLSQVLPPSIVGSAAWEWLPIASFSIVFGAIALWFWRRPVQEHAEYDAGMTLIAVSCLLFLILSRKSHLYYLAMMGIFMLHMLGTQWGSRVSFRSLVPFGVVNLIAPIEPLYWHRVRDATVVDPHVLHKLVALDVVLVACYAFYAAGAIRILSRLSGGADARAGAVGNRPSIQRDSPALLESSGR